MKKPAQLNTTLWLQLQTSVVLLLQGKDSTSLINVMLAKIPQWFSISLNHVTKHHLYVTLLLIVSTSTVNLLAMHQHSALTNGKHAQMVNAKIPAFS
jgi:hypothetical protein